MAKDMKSLKYVPQEKSLDNEEMDCGMPVGDQFPCLYVDSKQMPEIEDWEVGSEYMITVQVRMKSYSLNDRGDGRSNAELSIESYETKTGKSLD